MEIQLHIPDDVARLLLNEEQEIGRAALEALALEGYRSRRLSEAQVRRMLGYRSRLQVHAFLKAHDVWLQYSAEDLRDDLRLVDRTGTQRTA